MTTRDEEEKKKRMREKRRHLRVYQGLGEKGVNQDLPVPPASEEKQAQWVQLVVSRDQLVRMVRLARWGLWARRAVQAALWLLCGFVLAWGLLAILRAFQR